MRFSNEPPYSSVRAVRQRREELVREIAVRAVEFQPAVARRQRPRRAARGTPPRPRRFPPGSTRAAVRSLSGSNASALGADRQPAALRVSGTCPLPSHGRWVLALRPACASWMPGTAPCAAMKRLMRASGSICASFHNPASCGRDAPVRRDGRGLADHQPRAADRARAEVDEMPVVGHAVVGGIHAHRRNADAVAQGHVLEPEFAEQMWVSS